MNYVMLLTIAQRVNNGRDGHTTTITEIDLKKLMSSLVE